MKPIADMNFGFNDAENYQRKENKQFFSSIFVKNVFLDKLLQPSTFFLIGEKGTGKTAYAVFLSINEYKDTVASLKYLRETDYQKFVTLKKEKHLQLSDYSSIWKVILLLLLSKTVKEDELDHILFNKNKKMKTLMAAIDEYYSNAFSPEIVYALNLVENSKMAAEIISKHAKVGAESGNSTSFQESRFQMNLFYIQKQFEEALNDIKIKKNHILFIDGIDIRPGFIPYPDYLDCIKGLADAVWSLNNDLLANIKDSRGRFRVVLLVRPDIFNSIGLQNQSNKIQDNSVFLDWRTTYPNYRTSDIFDLSDKLLRVQQESRDLGVGEAWDYYFPWVSRTTSPERENDPSFYRFLRLSYSRPRDTVTMLKIFQEEFIRNNKASTDVFSEKDFDSHNFQNKYSEYLMGGIRDQLSFYYTKEDYEVFLKFFHYLKSNIQFSYEEYINAYRGFTDFVLENHNNIPEFLDAPNTFLQFLYDTNIICYIETLENEPFFRWCYRERSLSNISPKVKPEMTYRFHYGLMKALNVGFRKV